MRVLKSFTRVPDDLRGAVFAIGNFDGVHRGHQRVLAEIRAEAYRRGRPAAALLFDPHPRVFFAPDNPHFTLTPLPVKLELLAAAGLDAAVVLPFGAELAALPAEEFVERVLVDGLGVAHVAVGEDFHFGRGRGGDVELLQRLGERHGFDVGIIRPARDRTGTISSSRVRAALQAGDVRTAAALLGRWWSVRGIVAGGAGRGTGLGFPTANLTLLPGQDPKHGIYAARVRCEAALIEAVAYLGTRPTFDGGATLLEVFLFDFNKKIYGAEIEVELVDYIRGDQAFASVDALKLQMGFDAGRARAILEAIRNADPFERPHDASEKEWAPPVS